MLFSIRFWGRNFNTLSYTVWGRFSILRNTRLLGPISHSTYSTSSRPKRVVFFSRGYSWLRRNKLTGPNLPRVSNWKQREKPELPRFHGPWCWTQGYTVPRTVFFFVKRCFLCLHIRGRNCWVVMVARFCPEYSATSYYYSNKVVGTHGSLYFW